MKLFNYATLVVMAWFVLTGCASTDIVARHEYRGPKIARPNRIIVHDFAATADDVPSWAVNRQYAQHSTPQTADDVRAGRKLGGEVAQELVAKIRNMGLPAERATNVMSPGIGDLVLMGYFEAVDTGSVEQRVVVGFGKGAAHLRTVIEGFLMTDRGLRQLGSGEVDADSGKSPGAAVPLAAAVASGNPIGLIVNTAAHIHGESTGKNTVEGDAERTADAVAKQLQIKFREQGWIR